MTLDKKHTGDMRHSVGKGVGSQKGIKVGVIDLGTQTFRMAAVKVEKGHVDRIFSHLYNCRLGDFLKDPTNPSFKRVEDSLKEMVQFSKGLDLIKICGTEALRQIKKKIPKLFYKIQDILPAPVEILTPEEEGRLTALGVFNALGLTDNNPCLILDVGGGSTEAIYVRNENEVPIVESVAIGAVNFDETRLPTSLSFLYNPPFSKVKVMVGTGGTATTLASMLLATSTYEPWKIRGLHVKKAEVLTTIEHLASMTIENRRNIKGLEPQRADIIVPGLKILFAVLDTVGAPGLTISDGGLLMGILVESIKKELDSYVEPDWRRLYI